MPPWPVNAEADMKRLLEWDVEGIITDRPDLLLKLLLPIGTQDRP
jgi:glycerophosphoryl diester phosphodiesterase